MISLVRPLLQWHRFDAVLFHAYVQYPLVPLWIFLRVCLIDLAIVDLEHGDKPGMSQILTLVFYGVLLLRITGCSVIIWVSDRHLVDAIRPAQPVGYKTEAFLRAQNGYTGATKFSFGVLVLICAAGMTNRINILHGNAAEMPFVKRRA